MLKSVLCERCAVDPATLYIKLLLYTLLHSGNDCSEHSSKRECVQRATYYMKEKKTCLSSLGRRIISTYYAHGAHYFV